jgi:hypothetical protein
MIVRRWSRPSTECKALWQVYINAMIRARMVEKPFDKWAMKTVDEALDNYMSAVERELEALNNDT